MDASNRAVQLGASLIICVNGFVDSAESIGLLAEYVRDNRIPVAAWELCNEPYLFPGFFPDATTYLDKMSRFHHAIKEVDSKRDCLHLRYRSIQTSELPLMHGIWRSRHYPNKYWDAISFHHYPPQSQGDFDHWMKEECGVLAIKNNLCNL